MSMHQPCVLTTKDFSIIETMRERCLGQDDPLAPILKQKIETARVVFREDVPENVATLSSRVTFTINDGPPGTRVISHQHMTTPVGMFLSIATRRGLALLGLAEGMQFQLAGMHGGIETVRLIAVNYQPEATARARDLAAHAAPRPANAVAAEHRIPALTLVRSASPAPRSHTPAADLPDDPGPSAA
ncbi:nucleoside-diphosphate kinase [Pseudohoeflea coraliihabitans]|uniref:Nucleoside-diphosphate kinase n=1 Tax=Pseudohoeflea coraliihabitans TaxID=2860393 RepID=A0ABS6WQU1_9HYPH|nr:nucleoside-diphosphate kinase [Pseudohoeflea sp. DP4N28-3]MBW3098290.1 nucleoside-diphosphate kinase [Pseudohoeflea sp. DP4N28-3]